MDDEIFNRLIEDFKETKIIDAYIFTRNIYPLTAPQFDVLIKAIKESGDVKKINLTGQNMGSEQAKELAVAITGKQSLEDLELGLNHIGDEGAIAIAQAVRTTTALRRLAIYNNRIGEAGIIALAKVIKDHPSLNTAELDYNYLNSEKAIAALVEMIEGNFKAHKELWHISIEGCNISLEAANPFINLYRTLLREGTLPDNMPHIEISPEAKAEFMKLIKYAENVAHPLYTLQAAGLQTQSESPANRFVNLDGDNAAKGKIKGFLGRMPEKQKPPTPS